ncbi:MAG: phosphate/phosphite/phosphonate ABC transporter substrate-binding protein [Gammaproteobacteria bacterium]
MLFIPNNNLSAAILPFRRIAAVCLMAVASVNVMAAEVASDSQMEQGRILVIGGIDHEQGHVNASLSAMAKYIQSKMADLGVEDVVVVSAPDREHLAQLIRHGRVDWISQTAYNASYFIQNADVSVLSRGWRGGSPTYKSIFFVRADSALDQLEDVSNHTIAFEHPYSTSAYFVPRIELESIGNSLTKQPIGQASSKPDSVTYTFSQSEYNTAVWVQKGIVDIGVISDGRWQDSRIVPDSFRRSFRVLHETREVVRALELVRDDLDADIKQRLRTVLESIHADVNAKKVRASYFDTQRFDMPTEQDISRLNDFAAHTVPVGSGAPAAGVTWLPNSRALKLAGSETLRRAAFRLERR